MTSKCVYVARWSNCGFSIFSHLSYIMLSIIGRKVDVINIVDTSVGKW